MLIGGYFGVLCIFSFVSHPVVCCLFLLLNSLIVCSCVYLVLGVGWYILLFSLVYIGGVYILFVFVSVCAPNSGALPGINWWVVWSVVFFFMSLSVGSGSGYIVSDFGNLSFYLCMSVEGATYCFLGGILMLGLVIVSGIASFKDSFYR